uniref:Uncharacterized protein n=1 Tax=Auxenochlorella protothecoides TaxID=3075 RepID=A0A1D2A3Q2_AUXPR
MSGAVCSSLRAWPVGGQALILKDRSSASSLPEVRTGHVAAVHFRVPNHGVPSTPVALSHVQDAATGCSLNRVSPSTRDDAGSVHWAEQLALEASFRHAPFAMASPIKPILKQRPSGFVHPYADEPAPQLAWAAVKCQQQHQRRCLTLVGAKRPRLASWN